MAESLAQVVERFPRVCFHPEIRTRNSQELRKVGKYFVESWCTTARSAETSSSGQYGVWFLPSEERNVENIECIIYIPYGPYGSVRSGTTAVILTFNAWLAVRARRQQNIVALIPLYLPHIQRMLGEM